MGEEAEYSGVSIDLGSIPFNGRKTTAFHDERGMEIVSIELAVKIHNRLTILNEVHAIEIERRAKTR